jgi:hypothetical protein
MKTAAALVLISALSASAFVPAHRPVGAQTALQITKEEDIELTRKVILKHFGDDFGKAPAPGPAPAAAPAPAAEEASAPKEKKAQK